MSESKGTTKAYVT